MRPIRIIEYDGLDHDWPNLPWRCQLDEHTTLVAATREKLLADLDGIDKRNEERHDVVSVKDARRSHTDR